MASRDDQQPRTREGGGARDPERFEGDAQGVRRSFEAALAADGVHAALGVLNARVAHRFTGIYRFEAPRLRNLHLFDAQNPALEVTQDAQLDETYCSLVGAHDRPFATADAPGDARLEGHAALESVQAYCGVPVYDADGQPYGTLCHFDTRPQPWSEGEHATMRAAADVLPPFLPPTQE